MKLLRYLLLAVLAAAGIGFWMTRASGVDSDRFEGLTGDAEAGMLVFAAAGCASCHTAPDAEKAAEGDTAAPVLSGGQRFDTPFGVLVAPNVSPDPEMGIGSWTRQEFADAVMAGTSPDGRHFYPAFPYTAYSRMEPQDLADLWAYWQTLPGSDVVSAGHEMAFPFNIRRGIGVWKLLYMPRDWQLDPKGNLTLARGVYLVEALGHCAECHTPRDQLGGLDRNRWLMGAPNPTGKGEIPALTPDKLTWSETDIAYYLKSGFTPDFDSVGGHMTNVVENLSRLSDADRAAIAAYLKALP